MDKNEQQRLKTLIRAFGNYADAAEVMTAITGHIIWGSELQRAVNSGHLSPKLRRALLPPPPRYRVAIDCRSREDQRRLAELLRGDDGRRMSAAELIDMLERMR